MARKRDVIYVLQHVSEAYLTGLFEDFNSCMIHMCHAKGYTVGILPPWQMCMIHFVLICNDLYALFVCMY